MPPCQQNKRRIGLMFDSEAQLDFPEAARTSLGAKECFHVKAVPDVLSYKPMGTHAENTTQGRDCAKI